jgi:hypothetical protein
MDRVYLVGLHAGEVIELRDESDIVGPGGLDHIYASLNLPQLGNLPLHVQYLCHELFCLVFAFRLQPEKHRVSEQVHDLLALAAYRSNNFIANPLHDLNHDNHNHNGDKHHVGLEAFVSVTNG